MYKIGILIMILSACFILSTSFVQKYDLAKSVARGKEAYASFCMVTIRLIRWSGTGKKFFVSILSVTKIFGAGCYT